MWISQVGAKPLRRVGGFGTASPYSFFGHFGSRVVGAFSKPPTDLSLGCLCTGFFTGLRRRTAPAPFTSSEKASFGSVGRCGLSPVLVEGSATSLAAQIMSWQSRWPPDWFNRRLLRLRVLQNYTVPPWHPLLLSQSAIGALAAKLRGPGDGRPPYIRPALGSVGTPSGNPSWRGAL